MVRSTTERGDHIGPAETIMCEVGARLRATRLERGEEIAEVAEYLCIKPIYLHAIENGDLSALPGRTYALGFLRSYANYLGFDGNALIAQIKSTVADLTDRSRLRVRTPSPESRFPTMPLVVLSLAVVAAVYGGWSYLNHGADVDMESVAEVPDEFRRLALETTPGRPDEASAAIAVRSVPGPSDTARSPGPDMGARQEPGRVGQESGGAALAVRGQAPASGSSADALPESGGLGTRPANAHALSGAADGARMGQNVGGDAAGAAGAGAPAAAQGLPARPSAEELLAALAPLTSAADEAPLVYEPGNKDARVVLRARDVSWIRITSADGDYLKTYTLRAGDTFLVPNRLDLELWTGNAGGLELIVDGERLPPLGPAGKVMRDVSLDPQRLLARLEAGN